MKVILLKDVKKQGKKDDIINVSDGYANNYLIKNGLAVMCTETSNKILQNDLKKRADEENKLVEQYNKIKQELENKKIDFIVKIGAQEKVFGNISSKQISEALKKMGYNIDKKCILTNGNIDSLGNHIVKIKLHKKVEFNINIYLSK